MQSDPSQSADTPALTREQVRRLDAEAVETYGMPSLLLMENAGRATADTIQRLGIRGTVWIVCGRGNNAGDGLVVARHLDLRGYSVRIVMVEPGEALRGDALVNFQIVQRSGLPLEVFDPASSDTPLERRWADADWLVDALLGTGARGAPRSPMDRLIGWMNDHPSARRLAIDLPTGLDCDTGQPSAATFEAHHTCTFVAAKPGLLHADAARYVGTLHVLDIGAPGALVRKFLGEVSS